MPHQSRDLLHEYALEIICRAQSSREYCTQLLSQDFSSQAPRMLATTIVRMCEYLEVAVKTRLKVTTGTDTLADDKLGILISQLQIVDSIIRELGAHMRFVDGARTANLPWSVIRPFEKFAQRLIPGITVMLIPQWEYNYGIVTSDLCRVYQDCLAELGDAGGEPSLKYVFEKFKGPFHIVSFPALEKKNILLHCLLSHELGHLISEQYITANEGRFLKNNRDEIVKVVESRMSQTEPLFRQEFIKEELKRASYLWRRGLEETLSDVVGAILFGPAMLLSALEMSVQGDMDHVPSEKNSFYPPWRFRVREIYKVLDVSAPHFFPLSPQFFDSTVCSAVNKRIDLIKEIVASKGDSAAISRDEIMKIAYREVQKDIEQAEADFLATWEQSGLIVTPNLLYRKLKHLIRRLDNGIPPNAYEESIEDRAPANMIDIINAAWFYKIGWEDRIFEPDGTFNDSILKIREIMNVLTLKAIEFSDLEEAYRSRTSPLPMKE